MKTMHCDWLRIGKRALGLCLAAVLMLGVMTLLTASTALAEEEPKIIRKGVILPANHESVTYGKGYALAGTFTASVGKITKVSAYMSQDGVKRFIFEAKPKAKTYDIAKTVGTNGKTLNQTFRFGALSVGKWKLSITVTATNLTKTKTVTITRNFLIAQKITLSGGNFPGNSAELKQWQPFPLRGVFKVNAGKIATVKAYITDDSDTVVLSYSAVPKKESFDIAYTKNAAGKTLNGKLKFPELKPGKHILTIIVMGDHEAKWGSKASMTITRSFVIVSAPKPTATPTPKPKPTAVPKATLTPKPAKQKITKSGEVYPADGSTVPSNTNFSMDGTYKVNNGKIGTIVASVNDSQGVSKRYFTATLSGKTFTVTGSIGKNGKTMDETLLLKGLTAGKYTLELSINASAGAKYTLRRSFTIGTAPKFTVDTAFSSPAASYTKGKKFVPAGAAHVDVGKITLLTVQVKNSSGKIVSGFNYSKELKVKSYDLNKLKTVFPKNLKFENLPKGTYTYVVKMKAVNGELSTTKTLVKKTFKVK